MNDERLPGLHTPESDVVMSDEHSHRLPRRDSWESFRPVGEESRKTQAQDGLLSWVCLVLFLAILTVLVAPMLLTFCLVVAFGTRLFMTSHTVYVHPDKVPVFGNVQSFLLFAVALGVCWLTESLAEPIRAQYGGNRAMLARFAMASVAYAPLVLFLKLRLDRRERAEAAARQAAEEAKRRREDALLNRSHED